MVGWQDVPDKWKDHPSHAHNRLITSIVLNNEERRAVARAHTDHLSKATAPTAVLLPGHGCGEWDREGADLYDPDGLAVFLKEFQETMPDNVDAYRVDAHINDELFARRALEVFDDWCERGVIAARV